MSSKRVSLYLSTANQQKLVSHFGDDMNLSKVINQLVAEWQPNGVHAVLQAKCPVCGGALCAVIATGHVFCTGGNFRSGMPCDYETTVQQLSIDKE